MYSKILVLECITNMHVGNGDVNYSIIDNEVEKDLSGYPTINSSGVKGAFREFLVGKEETKDIDIWFGSEKTQGMVKILAAEFVARPLRASGGNSAFYMVTTNDTVSRVNYLTKTFVEKELLIKDTDTSASDSKEAEGIALSNKVFATFEGEKTELYVMDDKEFRKIDLPVLARNKLDNGESKNLWYEEIVPHGSIFIVPIVSDDKNAIDGFTKSVKGKIVQFGGNASIGYGLCKIYVVEG